MRFIIYSAITLSVALGQLSLRGPYSVVVQLDTVKGNFGIGDTAGHSLTFNYNYPWTRGGGFLVVMVDDTIWFTNERYQTAFCTNFRYLPDYPSTQGYWLGSIWKQWEIPLVDGPMILTLFLRPVEIDSAGVVQITYIINNNDQINHSFAVRLIMDIKVSNNDNPFLATTSGTVTHNTLFQNENIPLIWNAFEMTPNDGCAQKLAVNYLSSLGSTRPNYLALGSFTCVHTRCWEFDSTCWGLPNTNSTVLWQWGPRQINSGKYEKFTTFFGFAKCSPPEGDVALRILAPTQLMTNCDEVELPFEVAGLVYNDSLLPALYNPQLCLELPEGVSIVAHPEHIATLCGNISPDTLSPGTSALGRWFLNVDTTLWGNTIPIVISLNAEPGIFLSETSYVNIPLPDGVPPTAEKLFDYRYIACYPGRDTVRIPFVVSDESGVDILSCKFRARGYNFNPPNSSITFSGDTIFFVLPQWLLYDGDTIEYRLVSISDIYGCSADMLPPPDTLIVDLFPPRFLRFSPPSGSSVEPIPRVKIYVKDNLSGINRSSAIVTINEQIITGEHPWLFWEDDTTLWVMPDSVYPDYSPLSVCLRYLADRTEICGPNADTVIHCADYTTTKVHDIIKPTSASISLSPNPFNSSCKIEVFLPCPSPAKICATDILGKIVDIIADGEFPSGKHTFRWQPEKLPSGIYFIELIIDNEKESHRTIMRQRVAIVR